MKLLSFSSLLLALFLSYVAYSVYILYGFINVADCASRDPEHCLNPAFKRGEPFQLFLCTSLDEHPLASRLKCFHHNATFRLGDEVVTKHQIELPPQTVANGSLFLHAFATKLRYARELDATIINSRQTISSVAFLTRYQLKKAKTFNLLNSGAGGDSEESSVNGSSSSTTSAKRKQKTAEAPKKRPKIEKPVTHWRSRVVLSGVHHPLSLHRSDLPYEILHLFQLTDRKEYMPVLYLSDVRQRLEDLVEVPVPVVPSASSSKAPEAVKMDLEVVYEPVSLGRLRLMVIVERAFRQMRALGFGERELEDVKGVFFDTSHAMLLLTVLVISFHALFDFLAFKNDIQFWRRRTTMEGVSAGSIAFRLASSAIITLYLYDRQTSLLVLVPAAVGTLIELWKLLKVLGLQWTGWLTFNRRPPSSVTELERRTADFDSATMRLLSLYVLPPLLAAGAAYSIAYTAHRSWAAWALESAVNGVYAFGFLAMLPQLVINYRLKSVAHLPWRAFTYKAFNTFIDDFFAFLLTSVPTAHRLATFRDDIVFLVYLYQRWLYPIDKSRSVEGGGGGGGPVEETKKKAVVETSEARNEGEKKEEEEEKKEETKKDK